MSAGVAGGFGASPPGRGPGGPGTDRAPVEEHALRLDLVRAAQSLAPLDLSPGKSGNVSARCSRAGVAGFLVTPSGLAYDRLGADDIVWVPLAADDATVDPAASSEWRIHRDLYVHRTAFDAVVHAHSPHATALACTPRVQREGIPAFHYMVAAAGGAGIPCAGYATFGTQALSDAVVAALGERHRACLMAHHGIVAGAGGVAAAVQLAVEVEATARQYAIALSVAGACGEPHVLPGDEMDRVLGRFATYGKPSA